MQGHLGPPARDPRSGGGPARSSGLTLRLLGESERWSLSRAWGTHGKINREGEPPAFGPLHPHPSLGAPWSSLRLSVCHPVSSTQQPQVFFIVIFPPTASLVFHLGKPGPGAQRQLWFSPPPPSGQRGRDGGLSPEESCGGIPGRRDNRRPSNLLACNSLPGLSPPRQLWELVSAGRAEGAGAPGGATQASPRPRDWEAQGHRATPIRTLLVLGELQGDLQEEVGQ